MSKSLSLVFYATANDLHKVLGAVENACTINYKLAGVFSEASSTVYQTHADIEALGVASKGDQNQESTYLVSVGANVITARQVVRRDGVTMYAIDQMLNPASIVLRPGGLFAADCVVAGQIGTSSAASASIQLFRLFAREFRQHFRKIRSYQVGSEALLVMEAGGRLTTNVRAPVEYDLNLADR